MSVYSITVGFSPALYCCLNVTTIEEPVLNFAAYDETEGVIFEQRTTYGPTHHNKV